MWWEYLNTLKSFNPQYCMDVRTILYILSSEFIWKFCGFDWHKPTSLSRRSWQTPFYSSAFMNYLFYFFKFSHISDTKEYLSFSFWLIHLAKCPPDWCCCKWQDFFLLLWLNHIPFYVLIQHIFNQLQYGHFFNPFTWWWALKLSSYLGYCK